MYQHLTLVARLRLLAGFASAVVLTTSVYTGWQFYQATLNQRLSTTRGVVAQAQSIAQHYLDLAQTGKLPADEAQANAISEIKAIRYDGKEYVFVSDMNARMVLHPIKPELDGKDMRDFADPNGKKLFVECAAVVQRDGTGYVDYLWPRPDAKEPEAKRTYVAGFQAWNWVIGSGVYVGQARAEALRFAAGQFGAAVLMSLVLFFAVHGISRSLRLRLASAQAALEAIAQGDLSRSVESAGTDEIGHLMQCIARTRSGLGSMVTQVRASVDSISTASGEIAAGNQDLSSRTEQTASSLQQAAGSMALLTGTVNQTADSARTANQLAASAQATAARGGEVVSQVVSTMRDIHASSSKIADIIGVIDGIAFQTNILALNAAVEAARAGEQGRGFAVVASEVRSLASRSADAAREIKNLIGASVDRVEQGSRLVGDAGQAMTDIVGSVRRVSDIIAEITAAASEQSQGIGTVNGTVAELDHMTQQNAALVEQAAAAADSLKDQATKLAQAVRGFKVAGHAEAV